MSVGEMVIKERIIKDDSTFTVYFHNISTSHLKGLIYNRIYENEKKQLILEFGSDATNQNG